MSGTFVRRFWMTTCVNGHGFEIPGDEQPVRNFEAPYGYDRPDFPAFDETARCPACGASTRSERYARRCIRPAKAATI